MNPYDEKILATKCPVCKAGEHRLCEFRRGTVMAEPHAERIWRARGYRWYCFDCDEAVPKNHIHFICDKGMMTGSCKDLGPVAIEVAT